MSSGAIHEGIEPVIEPFKPLAAKQHRTGQQGTGIQTARQGQLRLIQPGLPLADHCPVGRNDLRSTGRQSDLGVGVQERHLHCQFVGQVEVIVVQEGDICAGACGQPQVARGAAAGVFLLQVHDACVAESGNYGRGVIDRAIIHHYDLEVGIALHEHTGDSLAQVGRAVASGNDDADFSGGSIDAFQ